MNRQDFIELARKDVRVPIGIDMILHQYPDVDAILDSGERMGKVLLEAANTVYLSPNQIAEGADIFDRFVLTPNRVKEMSRDLAARMRAKSHPFMLGTECDVLCVHQAKDVIASKVHAFMTCTV